MNQVVCLGCQRSLRYSEKLRGKKVRCPQCKTPVDIPLSEQEQADELLLAADGLEPLLDEDLAGADPLAGEAAVASPTSHAGHTATPAAAAATSRREWWKSRWTWGAAVGGAVVLAGAVWLLLPPGPKGAFQAYTRALGADDWGRIYDLSGQDERERIHQQIDRYLQVTRPKSTFAAGLSQRDLFIEISKRTRSKRTPARSSVPPSVRAAQREKFFRSLKVVRVEYQDDNQTAMVVYINPTTVINEKRTQISDELYRVESRTKTETYDNATEKCQYFVMEEGDWKLRPHDESSGEINALIF